MSDIDQVRAAVAAANDKALEVAGAIEQAKDGVLDVLNMLAQTASGSTQASVDAARAGFMQTASMLNDAQQMLMAAREEAESFAAGL